MKRIKQVIFEENVNGNRLRAVVEDGTVKINASHIEGGPRNEVGSGATLDEDVALAFFEAVVAELKQGKQTYRGG